MEYVGSLAIDTYCEDNQCTIEEKITLFREVLKAVRYAHENLEIHRDLKAGNDEPHLQGGVHLKNIAQTRRLRYFL